MPKFNTKSLTLNQKKTRRRILQVCFERKLAHIGSCLSAVDIIDAIYSLKRKNDSFVLSSGHAGLALYSVLEKKKIIHKNVLNNMHIHPDRNIHHGIEVSTGSLGHGLPIAVGMALADRKNRVYCLISDGEMGEGSIWESLRLIEEYKLFNLKVVVNANGWQAYSAVSLQALIKRIHGFGYLVKQIDGHNIDVLKENLGKKTKQLTILFAKTNVEQFDFLKGLDAHYYVMNDEDYKFAQHMLL